MSALGQYLHAPAGDGQGLSGSSPAARVWGDEIDAERCRPLLAMSGDCTAWEWSEALDVGADAVIRWCRERRLPLRGA